MLVEGREDLGRRPQLNPVTSLHRVASRGPAVEERTIILTIVDTPTK
jgi:hypothetical protein